MPRESRRREGGEAGGIERTLRVGERFAGGGGARETESVRMTERATSGKEERGNERETELADGLRHSVDGRSGVVVASSS